MKKEKMFLLCFLCILIAPVIGCDGYRRTKEGAIVGGVAGAAIGYGIKGPIGAALGGTAGALVGGAIGSFIENPRTIDEYNETLALKRQIVEDRCIQRVNNEAAAAQKLGRAWGVPQEEIIDQDEMRDEIRACIRKELGPREHAQAPRPERQRYAPRPRYSYREEEMEREESEHYPRQMRRRPEEQENDTTNTEEEEVYVGEEE